MKARSGVLTKARKVVLMVSLSRPPLISLRRSLIVRTATPMRGMPLKKRARVGYQRRKLLRKRPLL